MATFKRITALLLCALMIAGSLSLCVSAFPDNTIETANDEGQYDYFYKFDFDSIAAGSALATFFEKSPTTANPFGFGMTSSNTGSMPGTVTEKYEANGVRNGNYLRLEYSEARTSGWDGVRFEMTKNGKSYTIGNMLEVDFDMRWEGVSNLDKLSYTQAIALVSFRRTLNSPHRFLYAKVVAGEEIVNGEKVAVADKYLRVYTVDGKDVAMLDKAEADFTSFRVIYRDATQTFDVYVNDTLIVEGRSGFSNTSSGIGVNTLYSESYVVTDYDYDGMALSREEKPTQSNGTTASDRLSFTLFRADYSASAQTAYRLGVDNVIVREVELAPSRTAYYENSFEGAVNLVSEMDIKSNLTTTGYRFVGKSGIKIESETVDGKVNNFLTFAKGSRLNINDGYQIAQNGNWTVEFDVRATSDADSMQLFRIYDGTNTPILLSLNKNGTIKFGSNSVVVPDVKLAAADSGEWTHIAISMNVNPGDNKGKVDDWGTRSGSASLNYNMSLWVDGKFVGTAKMTRTEILFEKTATDGRTIIDTTYTREALTSAPDVSGFTLARKLSGTVSEYIDEATSTLYRIETDASGNFVAGALDDSSKTSTGSVKLTKKGVTHGDLWGFFHNSAADAAGITGAIDNIKIYEGVLPAKYAAGEKATVGTVNAIDFGSMAIGSYTATATQNGNKGGTGVVSFSSWDTSIATKKTDSEVGKYINITENGTGEKFYDMFTPNVSGKVFKTSVTLRNYESENAATFFGVRRQRAGGSSVSTALFRVSAEGVPYVTVGGKNYTLRATKGVDLNLTDDNEWVTISVIVDETGDTPLVSYLINGEPAYIKGASFPYPILALNLKGVLAMDSTNMGAIDQRIRLFQVKGALSVDLKELKTELVANPYPMWEDEVAIDFNTLESVEDLGPQFYVTEGVALENGVLKVPAGETLAWIDYNGVIADFAVEPASPDKGFNFEMVLKHTAKDNQVISLMVDNATTKIGYMDASSNNLLASGNTVTPAHVSRLDEEGFTELSCTMYSGSEVAYFLGDALVGKSVKTGNLPSETTNFTAVNLVSNSEYKEIYIRNGIKRALAEKTGDFITLDPDFVTASSSTNYPTTNIMGWGLFNKHAYTGLVEVLTDETDGQGYYRWAVNNKTTTHYFADVYINDLLEDSTVVFEHNIRFTPAEGAVESDPAIEFVNIRRCETDTNGLFESMLSVTSLGKLTTPYGILKNADGTDLVLSGTEWQRLAVIYDSDAGQVSYRVGGKIPYYNDDDGNLLLADKIQLKTPRYYRMDSYETRVRTISYDKGARGILELKEFKIFTINESATLDFIGLQKATEGNDIRIVAGLDMLYYGSVGFDVVAYGADGKPFSDGKSYETKSVFSSITETVDGAERTVSAKDYGYRYFVTASILGITDREEVKLEVTPYTLVNGEKLYGATAILDIDFTDADNGKASTFYKSVKLEGDNLSANFAATDYVHYTNDGALELNGLDARLAFNANCEGEVSVNLTNAFGEVSNESIFDVYVDGVLEGTEVIGFGHHTLVLAKGLEKGDHSFMIVKRSGGEFACVNFVSLCGELTAPTRLEKQGAVDVIVRDASGIQELGNVEVYVQTSEASGDYYIKYNFIYERSATNSYDYTNGKSNTQNNQKLYRIKGADIVKRVGVTTYENVFGALTTGEISLAIREKWQGVSAKDFIGGFHGDENLVSVDFYLDGNRIDTAKAGVYLGGSNLEMIQNTVINRCDTEETNVMNHNQKYLVNTNGIKLEQQVEFLVDDFQPGGDNTFLQMATVNRINSNLKAHGATDATLNEDKNLVGAYVNLLDANGAVKVEADLTTDEYNYDSTLANTTNKDVGKSTANRYIEYLGNPTGDYKGFYGLVGFVIDDASVKVDSTRLSVRLKEGDNKWYASFDTFAGEIVPKGEVWNISNSYFLDYNPAVYGN